MNSLFSVTLSKGKVINMTFSLGVGVGYSFSHVYKTVLQVYHFYNKLILSQWFLVALFLG